MRQYTVHLPVADNNGELFAPETYALISQAALQQFKGFTFDPTQIMGGWVDDDGKVYQEHMVRLILATEDRTGVLEFVEYLKTVFEQKAMYVAENAKAMIL